MTMFTTPWLGWIAVLTLSLGGDLAAADEESAKEHIQFIDRYKL